MRWSLRSKTLAEHFKINWVCRISLKGKKFSLKFIEGEALRLCQQIVNKKWPTRGELLWKMYFKVNRTWSKVMFANLCNVCGAYSVTLPSGNTSWWKISSHPSRNSQSNGKTRSDFRRKMMKETACDSCQMKVEKINNLLTFFQVICRASLN